MRQLDGFVKGINLGGWISQFAKYDEHHFDTFIVKSDIEYIASLGFDHVRVPVDYNVLEDEDGNPIFIFKNPKTDDAHFKKSQRGCCSVHLDGTEFSYIDSLTYDQSIEDNENMLKLVFLDGCFYRRYSLADIRDKLHSGGF